MWCRCCGIASLLFLGAGSFPGRGSRLFGAEREEVIPLLPLLLSLVRLLLLLHLLRLGCLLRLLLLSLLSSCYWCSSQGECEHTAASASAAAVGAAAATAASASASALVRLPRVVYSDDDVHRAP